MSEPFRTYNGSVYTSENTLHSNPPLCSHEGRNACATCDHDGYYEEKYGELCPWFKGGVSDD